MNDFFRAFMLGFCLGVMFMIVVCCTLAVDWLPKAVERGVQAALDNYEIIIQE